MKRKPFLQLQLFKATLFCLISLAVLLLPACSDTVERKDKYFNRGMNLFDQGNFTKARLEFKNVLQIDPKDADAYFMFGQIEEKEENWPKAYALFLRATELNPNHMDAQVHLGTIYAMAGEEEKALAAAEAALKVEPAHSSALVLKGFTRAKMGDKDAAISEVLAAIESDPNNPEAASLLSALYADQGDLERATKIAQESLAKNKERVASYLLLARLYAQEKNEQGVVSVLSDLIKLKPDDLQSRLHLASYYKEKGDTRQAEKVLKQAIEDLPDNTDAKLSLISLLKNSGELESAESLLQEYAGSSSGNYALKLELAKYYLGVNRKSEALDVLSDVINSADQATEGLQARTIKASILIKDEALPEAGKLIEEILEIDPKYKDALLIRAGIALMGNDPDKGIADLRTLLREDPGYVKAHRLKARAHLKKGEVELARQGLEDAIKIQPEEVTANFELVQLLINTGEFDDAVVVLEKMRRFAPENLKVLQGLAMVRDKLNHWDELATIAEIFVTKYPQNPLGYYYRGVSLQERGLASQSVADLEKALTLKSDSIEALVALAKSYFALKKPDDALQRIDRVVETNPNHFLAINLKGEVHLSQKQLSEAENAFKQVIAIKPEWPTPYRNLVKIRLLEGKKAEAVALLKQGFDKTEDPVLGVELANISTMTGQQGEAVQIYQSILEKNPKHLLASNNLAMILLKGEPDQEKLDQALGLVEGFELSDNPVILDTLGWVYIKRGELDRAISILERAARADSGIPDIDYHLGLAYYQQGRMEIAKRHTTSALSAEKGFDGIEDAKALLKKIPE
ncbi:MAG: tetratricopeptide repeat protein [Candidatus Thiodiazotropha sp. (ex Troendleina suluensis)]|nr:tetratricopeptide repeat protein [Candidatus Thiodiazotropha sp. (ex Troendleina suluensis)]